MARAIALSDIHGCNRTLLAMLDLLAVSKADTLYFLGDYVDRGPDSKGVIDTLWCLQSEGYQLHCLMGNHEAMTVSDYEHVRLTSRPGLGEAHLLSSFFARTLMDIPVEYIDWMRDLPRVMEIPGYILVHAGLNFNEQDPFSNEDSLIWMRDWYDDLNREWLGDRLIVHGHTPISVEAAKTMFKRHDELPVQDIDCGAVFYNSNIYGMLCAFDLTNRALVFQPNVEYL